MLLWLSPKPARQSGRQAVNGQLGCNIASKHACQAHCHTAKFVAPAAVALALAVALAVAVACVACSCVCVAPRQCLGGLVSVSYVIIK